MYLPAHCTRIAHIANPCRRTYETSQSIFKMAPATVTVVYPQGAKFNMDYYKSTHMPLVQEKWGSMGLTSCKHIFHDLHIQNSIWLHNREGHQVQRWCPILRAGYFGVQGHPIVPGSSFWRGGKGYVRWRYQWRKHIMSMPMESRSHVLVTLLTYYSQWCSETYQTSRTRSQWSSLVRFSSRRRCSLCRHGSHNKLISILIQSFDELVGPPTWVETKLSSTSCQTVVSFVKSFSNIFESFSLFPQHQWTFLYNCSTSLTQSPYARVLCYDPSSQPRPDISRKATILSDSSSFQRPHKWAQKALSPLRTAQSPLEAAIQQPCLCKWTLFERW